MIELSYSERFKKRFKKLPKPIKKRFKERLKLFLDNPTHSLFKSHPLKGNLLGLRAFSLSGDYRVLYKIGHNSIHFVDIGTHNQVY